MTNKVSSSFDRIKAAIEHKEPDRVPFDLGSTDCTGIAKKCYAGLRKCLGMPDTEVRTYNAIQQTAIIDEDMIERLKIDVKVVNSDPPSRIGLATNEIIEGDYHTFTDAYGVVWKMPVNDGHYFDMAVHPFENAETVEEIDNYPWPDQNDPAIYARMGQKAKRIMLDEKKAYCLERAYGGVWETALWVCGFEKFFCDMMLNKPFAHRLMEKATELRMQYWENALKQVGENVLIISEADDLAIQNSLMCSIEIYKEMIHPYHKKLFSFIKNKAKAKVYINFHTCGAIRPMIPLLIEEGVDIINPVQVNAAGMDTKVLKKEFGKDIVFWGGGIDTQYILQYGTKEQVREEVKRRIDDLAPGGGFVFAPVHNIQANVPPENVVTMWDTFQEHCKY